MKINKIKTKEEFDKKRRQQTANAESCLIRQYIKRSKCPKGQLTLDKYEDDKQD